MSKSKKIVLIFLAVDALILILLSLGYYLFLAKNAAITNSAGNPQNAESQNSASLYYPTGQTDLNVALTATPVIPTITPQSVKTTTTPTPEILKQVSFTLANLQGDPQGEHTATFTSEVKTGISAKQIDKYSATISNANFELSFKTSSAEGYPLIKKSLLFGIANSTGNIYLANLSKAPQTTAGLYTYSTHAKDSTSACNNGINECVPGLISSDRSLYLVECKVIHGNVDQCDAVMKYLEFF